MNPTLEEITERGYIEGSAGQRFQLGSREATDYLLTEAKKQVPMLSTENAQQTVDKKLGSLNELSPSTTPGYTPPPTDPTKTTIPKAYFTNELGQEAEYTQEQLNDPTTREFIEKNGYAMTRTEGPTAQAGELKAIDKQLGDLVQTITAYSVDEDPGYKLQKDSITAQFSELSKKMEEANNSRMASFRTLGIRGGTSRYAGGVQLGIEGEELKQGAERLAEIKRKEADAISAARSAYRTGKFTEFNSKVSALEKLRTNKTKELEDFNKKLSEANKKLDQTIRRSTRDGAIASLVAQGITDGAQILDYLNYDEEGNQVGDFTAKEVGDTLKVISPNNDLKNLPVTVKEFYSLKGQGMLPSGITGLPEEDQFFEYLRTKKAATTAPKSGKGGSKNLITLSEARTAGLPVSVVGSSEQEIVDSLSSPTPPTWFVEKLIAEQGNDDYAETVWNQYRVKVNQSTKKTGTGSSGTVKLYSK